jgi:glycosyltransferase involved in cell wall biosynthesis
VIGRNEGARLERCLRSVGELEYPTERIELIYVDGASTDDSCATGERCGARVLRVPADQTNAAAGRNIGWRTARHELVQFIDGDTVMHPTWLKHAVRALDDEDVLCVFGHCRELSPRANVYHYWAHHDWYRAPGPVDAAGGIALFRRSALAQVSGFDESLDAGEEPELCHRLRRDVGGTILCLDQPMVEHDIHMTRFGQYWRRCMRTGHAYAEVSRRHPDLHAWRKAVWRNALHASAALVALLLSAVLWTLWPLVIWMAVLCAAILRNAWRVQPRVGSFRGALLYSLHHYLAKAPMALGQCRYWTSAPPAATRTP